MTWGELKAANSDTPDSAEVYLEFPDDDGNIPSLESCEIDSDGDLVLYPEDDDDE